MIEIGSYRGSSTTLTSLIVLYITLVYISSGIIQDDRKPWLNVFTGPVPTLVIAVVYILFSIVWGPRAMQNRKPIKFRPLIIFYNLTQVVMCTFIFIQFGRRTFWKKGYRYFCQPADYSTNEDALELVNLSNGFLFLKLLDFVDSIFIILDKRFNQLSFLHVFHHSSIYISTAYLNRHWSDGHWYFGFWVNILVHAFMYSYYLAASLGSSFRPPLFFKKCLTVFQITQFFIIFFHALSVHSCSSEIPKGMSLPMCGTLVVYVYYFVDFYMKSYKGKGRKIIS